MFYLNVGYSWKVALEVEGIKGAIFLAASNSSERIARTHFPDFSRVLLDPQLYLAGLDANDCSTACARLASFPWFCVKNLPEFHSGEMKRREWESRMKAAVKKHWPQKAPSGANILHACRSAIEYQETAGCSHIILPSPLIDEREGEAGTQAEWLDACLEVSEELQVALPILATVAIDEATLNESAFVDAGFLDTVVDQVTSREGVDGVYIVIAQTHRSHPFDMSPHVARAYAWLCSRFSDAGTSVIIPNFSDVFGLACMAIGATGFCNGPSQTSRRLCLLNYMDKGGGTALPHLYSHRTIAEFRSEADLDNIVSRRVLGRVRDETSYSQDLMDELRAHGSAANVPPWVESKNNITAAQRHFIERLVTEHQQMARTKGRNRLELVTDWLESATANMLLVQRKFGKLSLKGQVAPAEEWLSIMNEITDED